MPATAIPALARPAGRIAAGALLLTLLLPAASVVAAPVGGESESAAYGLAQKHLRDGNSDACLNLAVPEAAKAQAGSEWPGILAVCLALSGNDKQAETALAKASSSGSYAATARALMAAHARNWPRAESEARSALAKDPVATAPLLALGQAHIARGRTDSAAACYRKVLSLSPRHALAHSALGGIHLAKQETAPALEHFAAALSERPQDAAARVGIGLIYQGLGMYEPAERAFAAAVAQEPGHLQAALGLAEIRLFNNDAKGAITALDKFAKSSREKRVHLVLADARFRAGGFDAALEHHRTADAAGKDPVSLHGRALAQLAKQDNAGALASLDAALAAAPGSSSYRLARGVALTQLGRGAEAHADFAKARSLAPVAPLADFADALAFLAEGKAAEAAAAILKATEALPGFIPGSVDWSRHLVASRRDGALELQRAFLLIRNQQGGEAARALSAPAAKAGESLLAQYLLGKALRLQGERAKAVAAFEAAARIEPAFLTARLELAKLRTDAGEYAQAASQYEALKAADAKGRWIPPMQLETFLGSLKEKMGDAAGALAHYRRALELSPENAYLHNQAGWILGTQKEWAAAKAHLEKAVKLEPRALAYVDNLGWVQYLSGDYAASLKSLQAAEAKGYKDPSLSFHLGMAYHRLKNPAQAKKYLAQALALSSEFKGAEEARTVLAGL